MDSLKPTPNLIWEKPLGYEHFQDPTVMPFNRLTFPSRNCTIPFADKAVPDKGKLLVGQAYTQNQPIIGNKERFTTMGGESLEVRVWRSDVSTEGDVIEVLYNNLWYRITQNVNPLPVGVHRYSFDQWFDTNLNPSLSLNLPRLVWVNGLAQIFSWTGGIAPIISIVPNTSISTTTGVTWASLGFVSPALGGSGNIIINGVAYAITGGWSTDTLTLSNTSGITVGDIAFSQIEMDSVSRPLDYCKQSKNHMFYGQWTSRKLSMSNAFNRPSTVEITQSQAVQNDLIVTDDSQYTGTGSHVYKVTIDSVVQPPVQEFAPVPGPPESGVNNAVFIGDHSGLNRDVYELVVDVGGTDVVYFFNSVLQFTFAMASATPATPQFLDNGISVYFVNPANVAHDQNTAFFYTVGGQDTFQYQIDNGVPVATFIPITETSQSLGDGINIQFVRATGHTVGDYWNITVNQSISEAWHNFYYTLPTRKPGEGFEFNLPSNFWTMDTQEDKLYVNTQYGEWSTVTSELSADLLSEKVNLSPLKQSGALKVVDPWMTGHIDDDLVFITEDKSLMSIGRKQFLQEPQDGYLSDLVKLDFLPCSFVGGGIKYIGKRLYITSPEQSIMHCFDTARGYWQAPKDFPEMGIPTIIGNKLCVHSNIRNQTFEMFGSDTDDGQAYTVVIRTPASAAAEALGKSMLQARWTSKYSGASFIEGYVEGAPQLEHTVYTGVNGCSGEFPHIVSPIMCVKGNHAPFGEGSFGSHSFGSDTVFEGTYFNEIFSEYKPILEYYFLSLGIICISKNHTYSILSMSMNCVDAPTGNNSLWNNQFKEDESML